MMAPFPDGWMLRLYGGMTESETAVSEPKVASAARVIRAPAATIFELIADPAEQPRWDGNDNLVTAAPGQRVRQVGDVFVMTIHLAQDRENHIVEFEEGRRIAWRPSEVGAPQPGHLWRWEVEPIDDDSARVIHTYDWTDLNDPNRLGRARAMTPEKLMASLDRLAALAESLA
ncbi:SRPBCC family protein [Nostocoides veronense]|uniref:SRPBCC family protein n=2 Tax=Nostocoides veronense TaxID=330836 RepID=A0ABN2LBK4_9MICO